MKEKPNRKAIIWGRFSSSKQEEGDSKERQDRKNNACAVHRGIQIVGNYFDEGVSVKDGATPLFKQTIKNLPKGIGIITENLDRINRGHPWRAKAYIADILEEGHFIITSDDDREYSAETIEQLDTMVLGDMASNVARYENNKRRTRVREEKAKALQLAREGKPAPLGGWLPSYLRYCFETGKYIVKEDIKNVSKRIFQMYLDGLGTSNIAGVLNKENVPTFGSKLPGRWARASISQHLRYYGVIGTLIINDEKIPNAFPAAVSEDIFYAVQTKLKGNKNKHGNYASDNVNSILRGISICAHCGWSVKVRLRNSRGYKAKYYICTGFREKKCTIKNNVRSEELEYEFVKWLVPQAKDALLGRTPELDLVETLKGKKDACNERISETMALWDKGLKLAKVEERLTALQKELATIDSNLIDAISSCKNDEAMPGAFNELDKLIDGTLDNNEMRKRIASIVPTIVKQVKIDLKDREQPSFDVTLVNGKQMQWQYVIQEYWQNAKGKGVVVDGRFKITKEE